MIRAQRTVKPMLKAPLWRRDVRQGLVVRRRLCRLDEVERLLGDPIRHVHILRVYEEMDVRACVIDDDLLALVRRHPTVIDSGAGDRT